MGSVVPPRRTVKRLTHLWTTPIDVTGVGFSIFQGWRKVGLDLCGSIPHYIIFYYSQHTHNRHKNTTNKWTHLPTSNNFHSNNVPNSSDKPSFRCGNLIEKTLRWVAKKTILSIGTPSVTYLVQHGSLRHSWTPLMPKNNQCLWWVRQFVSLQWTTNPQRLNPNLAV